MIVVRAVEVHVAPALYSGEDILTKVHIRKIRGILVQRGCS